MKFLHTSDWHIGRTLNGFDLIEEQKYAVNQILALAQDEQVDGIIIAGDLYDRAIPSTTAVTTFNQMLKKINIESKIPIYMIAGNHDGARRLNFGREWLGFNDIYLNTLLDEAFQPIETDEVQLFLLPFFDPADARIYFSNLGMNDERVKAIKTISDAMVLVLEELKKQFDPTKQQILVTHFAISAHQELPVELTSETASRVGGLATMSSQLFEGFDYVALGHIHTNLASPSEKVQYSGSPVKFNTKEANSNKGVYIIELEDGHVSSKFLSLKQQRDLVVLKETWDVLINPDFYNALPLHTAWFAITIKKFERLVHRGENLRAQLQKIYGTIVELDFEDLAREKQMKSMANIENLSEELIIERFYERVTGKHMSTGQEAIVEETLIQLKGEKN